MEEEPRIGVYVCHCGSNIEATVDVEKVRAYAETLPYVVVAQDHKYCCSDPGQELIQQGIKEHNLNRVVVASCSPRMHEPTFQRAVAAVGLNPYFFQMANIREQCSWVHPEEDGTTRKAQELVAAAVRRVALHQPLFAREEPVTPATLVVGGGIAGIQAALDIAEAGYQVYLVEREPTVGGRMAQLDKTFPTLDCST